MNREKFNLVITKRFCFVRCSVWKLVQSVALVYVHWEVMHWQVIALSLAWSPPRTNSFLRVGLLGSAVLTGAKVLPKLKMSERSIEYKYHEGNVKRTLKRELIVFETVTNQAISFVGLSLFLSFYLRCTDVIRCGLIVSASVMRWDWARYGKLTVFIVSAQKKGSK